MGHQQRDFFDPVAAASQFRELRYRVTRELIPEFYRRMEALAPNWRQGDPIPPQLRRKYAEIQRLMAQAEIIKALMPPGQQQLLE